MPYSNYFLYNPICTVSRNIAFLYPVQKLHQKLYGVYYRVFPSRNHWYLFFLAYPTGSQFRIPCEEKNVFHKYNVRPCTYFLWSNYIISYSNQKVNKKLLLFQEAVDCFFWLLLLWTNICSATKSKHSPENWSKE